MQLKVLYKKNTKQITNTSIKNQTHKDKRVK